MVPGLRRVMVRTWSQESDAAASAPGAGQLAVQPSGQREAAQRVQGGVAYAQHVQELLVDVDELLETTAVKHR